MTFQELYGRVELAFDIDDRKMWSEGQLRRVALELLKQYGEQLQPPAPPPLAVGDFAVRQCDVLGRWMVCGKCGEKHLNLYERKELRRKGGKVGHVGVLFNVDEKCRVVRMSIIEQWTEDA